MGRKNSRPNRHSIEKLDDKKVESKSAGRMSIAGVVSSQFQGPVPPPELLRQYEELLPGLADRLIAMAENQSAHRQNLERKAVYGATNRANWGLALGFIIAILFLGSSVFLVADGHGIEGTVLGTVDLVGLVSAFLYARTDQRNERQAKRTGR